MDTPVFLKVIKDSKYAHLEFATDRKWKEAVGTFRFKLNKEKEHLVSVSLLSKSRPWRNSMKDPIRINKETVVKIKTSNTEILPDKSTKTHRLTTFVPFFYICGSKTRAKRIFSNAILVKGVRWDKVYGIKKNLVGADNDGKPIISDQELAESLESAFTVIPMKLEKTSDASKEITSWNSGMSTLIPGDPSTKAYSSPLRGLQDVLLSKVDSMQVLLNGKVYDSPCRFCSYLMKRVADQCPIAYSQGSTTKLCRPKLMLTSDLFSDSNVDIDDAVRADVEPFNLGKDTPCLSQDEK